jgi:hypothetical protein
LIHPIINNINTSPYKSISIPEINNSTDKFVLENYKQILSNKELNNPIINCIKPSKFNSLKLLDVNDTFLFEN